MREEDSSWFSKWEEELPSPEELTPLSQTLISRDLAAAFDIQPTNNFGSGHLHHQMSHHRTHRRSSAVPPPVHQPTSGDFDSSSAELGGGGGGSEEPARTLKRPRLVWTPQLHKRFVDAVAHLGIKNAVPKTIMQLMSVDGLTRENVASHLQKYRLYLKRMQGINSGGGSGAGGGSGDSATDHLFASSPVPAHFLHPQGGASGGRPKSERFMGYGPPAALHHQQQVAAMVSGAPYHHHHHPRQMGQFEHPFLSRQDQMSGAKLGFQNSVAGFGEGVDSGSPASGKKALTLFPNGDV